MGRHWRSGLFGAGLALGGGCITYSTEYDGNPVTHEMAGLPKIGVTTKAEVLRDLGAPHRTQVSDIASLFEALVARAPTDHLTVNLDPALVDEVFVYERTVTTRFGVIGVLFNYYTSDRLTDRLVIVFDRADKVLAIGWTPGMSGAAPAEGAAK